MSSFTGGRRLDGFRLAHEDAGVPVRDELLRQDESALTDDPDHHRVVAESLLDEHPDLTAVLCANNRNTVGLVRALARRGGLGRSADELTVLAFDDFELADVVDVALLVVDHDGRELGRCAARMLTERLDDGFDGPARMVEALPTSLHLPLEVPSRADSRCPGPADAEHHLRIGSKCAPSLALVTLPRASSLTLGSRLRRVHAEGRLDPRRRGAHHRGDSQPRGTGRSRRRRPVGRRPATRRARRDEVRSDDDRSGSASPCRGWSTGSEPRLVSAHGKYAYLNGVDLASWSTHRFVCGRRWRTTPVPRCSVSSPPGRRSESTMRCCSSPGPGSARPPSSTDGFSGAAPVTPASSAGT